MDEFFREWNERWKAFVQKNRAKVAVTCDARQLDFFVNSRLEGYRNGWGFEEIFTFEYEGITVVLSQIFEPRDGRSYWIEDVGYKDLRLDYNFVDIINLFPFGDMVEEIEKMDKQYQ